jgi:hypothetical protein
VCELTLRKGEREEEEKATWEKSGGKMLKGIENSVLFSSYE